MLSPTTRSKWTSRTVIIPHKELMSLSSEYITVTLVYALFQCWNTNFSISFWLCGSSDLCINDHFINTTEYLLYFLEPSAQSYTSIQAIAFVCTIAIYYVLTTELFSNTYLKKYLFKYIHQKYLIILNMELMSFLSDVPSIKSWCSSSLQGICCDVTTCVCVNFLMLFVSKVNMYQIVPIYSYSPPLGPIIYCTTHSFLSLVGVSSLLLPMARVTISQRRW